MIVIIIGRIFICIISMLILFMYLDFLLNSSIFAWSFDLKAAILAFCQVFVSFIILLSFTESTSFFLTPALNRFNIIEKPIIPSAEGSIPFIIGSALPSGPSPRNPKRSPCKNTRSKKFRIKLNSIIVL